MCGLVGYMGKVEARHKGAMQNLLQFDVVRGSHSTGAAFINKQDFVRLVKDVLLPEDLILTNKYQKALGKKFYVWLGHNRFATRGKIEWRNAHPFMFKNVVGMHNGTLFAQHRLDDHLNFESDSENIFYMINKRGIEETWKQIDGAAALVFWERKKKTLNIITNGKRPMTYGLTKDGKGLFWASETWMIQVATKRNGIEMDQLWAPSADQLLTFSINAEDEIEKEIRHLDPFVLPVNRGYQRGKNVGFDYGAGTHDDMIGGFDNNYGYGHLAAKRKSFPGTGVTRVPPATKAYTTVEKRKGENNVLSIIARRDKEIDKAFTPAADRDKPEKAGRVMGSNDKTDYIVDLSGTCLNREQFEKKYSTCAGCGDFLEFSDEIVFITKEEAACEDCQSALEDRQVFII